MNDETIDDVEFKEVKAEAEEKPKTEEEVKKETKAIIALDEQGIFRPKDLNEAYRVAKMMCSSGMLPQRFNSPEMVLTGMQMAVELGLKPLTGLRQIAVIKGTPSLFGDLPLALVNASGKLEDIKEWVIDKEGKEICSKNGNLTEKAFGAVCILKRKNIESPVERYFTMEDAECAGLLRNPVWKSYSRYMLKYRARSQAVKDLFPDCLNGIAIAEYDFDEKPSQQGNTIKVSDNTTNANNLFTK